ncbi:hypothetical protein M231_00691 [Tremella mesenterica]|uniref:BTB domain-containing protein n=1 Tax=Tremella mesenterica TaxID=5217 RepID=A0A4Q1BV86_TREME|nr:hypothetical protein M231_00691 [Tremella mesenterica]
MSDKTSSTYADADADADLTLVSSDDIHFKVHSYHLKSASAVFRAMLEMPDPNAERPNIHLTDREIENAEVLEGALNILYSKAWPIDTGTYRFKLIKINRFLLKYECEGAIDKVVSLLHRWIAFGRVSAWYAFLVSADLNDVVTCSRAMRRAGLCAFSGTSGLQDSESTSSPFDIAGLSLERFSQIPVPMLWAILRATRHQNGLPTSDEGWDKMAKHFCELLKVKDDKP